MTNKIGRLGIIVALAMQMSFFSFLPSASSQNVGDLVTGIFGTIVVESIRQDQANKQQKSRNAAATEQRRQQAIAEKTRAKRVQSALKSLGFYTMAIDGDWGPGTNAAISSYRSAFNLYGGEFSEYDLQDLEGRAAEGWRNADEIEKARTGNFYSRQEMLTANKNGFNNRSEWQNATASGFSNANDYSSYLKAGFSSASVYLAAQSGGFSSEANYVEAKELGFITFNEYQNFRASGYKSKKEYDDAKVAREFALSAQKSCEQASTNRDWVAAQTACNLALSTNPNNSTIATLAKTASNSLQSDLQQYSSELQSANDNLAKLLENPNELEQHAFQKKLTSARTDVQALEVQVIRIELHQNKTQCLIAIHSSDWEQAQLICKQASTLANSSNEKTQEITDILANMNDMVLLAKNKITEQAVVSANESNRLVLASAQERGRLLLQSVSDYSTRGNLFNDGLAVARALVSLNKLLPQGDAKTIEKAIGQLSDLTKADAGFVADQVALLIAKEQAELASAFAARKGVEQINMFLKSHVAKNFLADNVSQLLELQDRLELVLKDGNASQMASALAAANTLLQKGNLNNELNRFVASLGAVTVSENVLKQQKAQALAANSEMQIAREKATNLINLIELYSNEGRKFTNPLGIARSLVGLKTALEVNDVENLIQSFTTAEAIINTEKDFLAFNEQVININAESRLNANVLAAETGEYYDDFLLDFISKNITSPNIGQMLTLQGQLEKSLNDKDWQSITLINKQVETFLSQNELSAEFSNFVALAQSNNNEGVALAQADSGIVINAANSDLLEGDGGDFLILQNTSGSSPNISKNLFGKVIFENGNANICWLHDVPNTSMATLLLKNKINELGVKQVNANNACVSNFFEKTDLILVKREEFLRLPASLARPAILAFEDGRLTPFAKVSSNDVKEFQAQLDQSADVLKAEIIAEEREGYGLVSLPNAKGDICMSSNTDLLAHSNLLARENDVLDFYFSGIYDLSPISIERAFVLAQRQLCSGIYADATDLKLLLTGLEREKISYLLVPVWFTPKEYKASVAAIDETKAQRKARLLAQQQRAESEAELRKQQASEEGILRLARQEKMREENRDVAMGEFKILSNTAEGFLEGKVTEFAQLFSQTAKLRNSQIYDKWEMTGNEIKLLDYGTGVWRSRRVGAILAKLRYKSENAVLGQYREDCVVIGYLIDDEFNLLRDSVEAKCSDNSTINEWKISHQFESGWIAE